MASMLVVTAFEVKRAVRKKTFWYATVAPIVIILAVLGISHASKQSAEKNSQQQAQVLSQSSKIGLLDESGIVNRKLLPARVALEPSRDAGIAAVRSGQIDAFFYYPGQVASSGIQVYAQDKGIGFTPQYEAAASGLLRQMAATFAGGSARNVQAVQILQKDPGITTTTYKNGKQTNGLAALIAPGVFALALFTLLALLLYQMVAITIEEKENRAAEMLLTSVSARTLILGKIMAIFSLGAIQLVTIIVPLLVYYERFKSNINLPGNISLSQVPLDPVAVTLGGLFFVGGFVMYTGIVVGLGAMFPSANEASRFLGLAIIWAFLPIYTLQLIISSPDVLIVKVFTYFPLTAPSAALLRNTFGSLSLAEALPALLVVYASAALAILFAIRAFRYGAMEYGRRISLRELLRLAR